MQQEVEMWADIPGFEGLYQVSNLARVRSFRREKAIILKQTKKTLYPMVTLRNGNYEPPCLVHRLVAFAFVPNPDNKPEVNHEDGNKYNCVASNLGWATEAENAQHAWRTGLCKPRYHMRGRQGERANHKRGVKMLSMDGVVLKTFACIMDAARYVGKCGPNITAVCNGRRNSAGGYIWEHAD
jgi:hypothetical protein